jgi:hypothetical protein
MDGGWCGEGACVQGDRSLNGALARGQDGEGLVGQLVAVEVNSDDVLAVKLGRDLEAGT